jgi:transposase-like protein
MDDEDTKQEVTCPHCYNYIRVDIGDELFVCPVCGRSFTDEDLILYSEALKEEQ